MEALEVTYKDERGENISLTKEDVAKIVSTDEAVTEKEVFTFLKMCQYLKLNPFLKEIYLIKYKGTPATFIVSYQALLKRAEGNENFDGYETKVEGEGTDLSATATVYRKDRTHPTKVTVRYTEAAKTVADKRTGEVKPTAMWRNMPRWMIRKVALARALKEAFPSAIGNAQVAENEIVDIDEGDRRIRAERKNEDGQKAVDDLYGVSEKELKQRNLKSQIYETLKEKEIDTIAKVKEILEKAVPEEKWETVGKNVFEQMPKEKLEKVMAYLTK